jgi:hypothetical protein
LEAGYSTAEAIRQLALHAPTPETFAAGVTDIEIDATLTFPTVARQASIPDLVALSERYGLSPTATAEMLAASCAAPEVTAAVVQRRCDADLDATVQTCATVMDAETTIRALHRDPVVTRLDATLGRVG